jgi:hypothetical protein
MAFKMKCPICGGEAALSGGVSCWCDKDFCMGQRCSANDLHAKYSCTNGHGGTPSETQAYYERHSKD